MKVQNIYFPRDLFLRETLSISTTIPTFCVDRRGSQPRDSDFCLQILSVSVMMGLHFCLSLFLRHLGLMDCETLRICSRSQTMIKQDMVSGWTSEFPEAPPQVEG